MPVDLPTFIALACTAFFAGAVDAIVGGGGLLQLPALLLALPGHSVATVFGTNKLVSVFGTTSAAFRYGRHIPPSKKFVLPMAIAAFFGSVLGANCVRLLPPSSVKPLVLVLLALVWLYTLMRSDFGSIEQHHPHGRRAILIGVGGGAAIGFYDGLVGPGTGSFLIFLLIGGLGMSFLRASATAKIVNVTTNVAALLLFAATGHLLFLLGLAMAVFNVLGSIVGSHLAISKGSRFVRIVFLVVVAALIVRLGFDVW